MLRFRAEARNDKCIFAKRLCHSSLRADCLPGATAFLPSRSNQCSHATAFLPSPEVCHFLSRFCPSEPTSHPHNRYRSLHSSIAKRQSTPQPKSQLLLQEPALHQPRRYRPPLHTPYARQPLYIHAPNNHADHCTLTTPEHCPQQPFSPNPNPLFISLKLTSHSHRCPTHPTTSANPHGNASTSMDGVLRSVVWGVRFS